MKVRIVTPIAGHAEPMYGLPEFSFSAGDVVDVHADLAAAWFASGVAEKTRTRAAAAEAPLLDAAPAAQEEGK